MLTLILTVACCTIIGVSSQTTTTPQPTVPTCNFEASSSTLNPQSSEPGLNPKPTEPTSDPESSEPNPNPNPNDPPSDPQSSEQNPNPKPTGPTSDPQSSQPNPNPNPNDPTSDPQSSEPNTNPKPTGSTSNPESSEQNPNSKPTGPTSDPDSSEPNPNPNPNDPPSDPQSSGPNPNPQPSESQPSVPGDNPQSSMCSTYEWGTPSVQFLTPGITYDPDGLFFEKKDKKLCFCDRLTSICHSINLKTGKHEQSYVNISEGKQVAFKYPLLNLNDSSTDEAATTKKYLIGLGNEIVPGTYNSATGTELNASPILITEDKGYIICKAHADKNGNLFIAMNSKYDKKHKHGRLYKIEKNKPVLVKQFDCDVNGFVWSHDYKTMYIITDHGKCIKQYSYDEKQREISNEKKVFEMTQTANPADAMTAIEIDKENNLWVTVEYCGNVLQIDSKTGKVKQTIQMPITMLTGITFDGKNGLFISTSKKCNLLENRAGSILYMSGLKSTGVGDNDVSL